MTTNWIHKKTIIDSEDYEINGLNIWNFNWEDTGEKINITDPLYGQNYTFSIYKIGNKNISVYFAAGEFSNCIWGIYQKE